MSISTNMSRSLRSLRRRSARFFVGSGRYVVVRPATAEVAFAVIDEFQCRGMGSIMMHHLIIIARAAGLKELIAEVLPENVPMLKILPSGADRG